MITVGDVKKVLEGIKEDTPLFFMNISGYDGVDPKNLRVEKVGHKVKVWDDIVVDHAEPTPSPKKKEALPKHKKKGSLTITRRQKKGAIKVED